MTDDPTVPEPDVTSYHAVVAYRRVLEKVDQAVIVTAADGRVTFWNRAAEKLYGWTAEEALGAQIVELTPAEPVRAEASAIMERLAGGESWSGEFRVRGKDGGEFRAWVTDVPVLDDDGQVREVIGLSYAMPGHGPDSRRRREPPASA